MKFKFVNCFDLHINCPLSKYLDGIQMNGGEMAKSVNALEVWNLG